jgi:hypothetical protein
MALTLPRINNANIYCCTIFLITRVVVTTKAPPIVLAKHQKSALGAILHDCCNAFTTLEGSSNRCQSSESLFIHTLTMGAAFDLLLNLVKLQKEMQKIDFSAGNSVI